MRYVLTLFDLGNALYFELIISLDLLVMTFVDIVSSVGAL
jgi:hypothetical protein